VSSIAETTTVLSQKRIWQVVAFIGSFAVLLYYALRGGSYDIVVRQEEAVGVWWVVGLGWAFGAFPRYRRPRGAVIPLAALALLMAWTALSLAWTASDDRTLAELARLLHYGGLIVLVWSMVGRDTWRAAAFGVIAAAVTVCGLAVASRLAPSAFPADRVQAVFWGTTRLTYPFNYWNAVAAWSAMTVALALAVSAHAGRVWLRALLLAFIPVCALAAYLTYARQSVLGVVVAVAAVTALSRHRWTVVTHVIAAAIASGFVIAVARDQAAIANARSGDGAAEVLVALALAGASMAIVATLTTARRLDRVRVPPRRAQVAAAAGTVIVVLICLTWARPTIADGWDQFRNVSQARSTSQDPAARLTNLNGGRYEQWRVAVDSFRAHPVKGTGAGTYEFAWDRSGNPGFVRNAHSLYLETAGELGVVGLLLILTLLGGLLYVALRRRRHLENAQEIGLHTGLVAAFVVFTAHAAVDWVWQTTAISALAFASIALAGTRRRRVAATESREQAGGRAALLGRAARVVVPVIAVAAILVEVPNLTSASLIRGSREAFQASNFGLAGTRADDAVAAAPWAAAPYMQRGLIFEAQDQLRAATADMTRAAAREPLNWRPYVLLARIEAERGRIGASVRAFRTAKRLRPASLFTDPTQ
jgi:hypothetical protein